MPKFRLVAGTGDYARRTACLVSAAIAFDRLARGQPLGQSTTKSKRICPIIWWWAVRLNDMSWWESDKVRTAALTPLIPRLIGPDLGKAAVHRRQWYSIDASIRQTIPFSFRQLGLDDEAGLLAAIPVISYETRFQAAEACLTVKAMVDRRRVFEPDNNRRNRIHAACDHLAKALDGLVNPTAEITTGIPLNYGGCADWKKPALRGPLLEARAFSIKLTDELLSNR